MVFSCAGDSDPAVLERVVSLGEGVPFLVEEMLVSPGLPRSFADGVVTRLAGLPEEVRLVLLAAAAFGRAALVHMPLWRLARRLAAEAASKDGWPVPGGWLTEAEVTLRSLGFHRAAAACHRLRGAEPDDLPPAWVELGITRREADVLLLVVEGCANREIAERLYLSVRTVEKHVESLLRKTASKNRT